MMFETGGIVAQLPSIAGDVLRQWRVIATIKHADGTTEPRRVYLENLTRAEAETFAASAVRLDPKITKAWAEKAPQTGGHQ